MEQLMSQVARAVFLSQGVMVIFYIIGRLVKKHETNCPFRISRELNYHVRFFDLPMNIYGFYQRSLRRNFIVINQNHSYEWQRFTCAHELGHIHLHKGYSFTFIEDHTLFNPDRYEKEANQFAVALLTYGAEIADGETIENFFRRNLIPQEMTKYYTLAIKKK